MELNLHANACVSVCAHVSVGSQCGTFILAWIVWRDEPLQPLPITLDRFGGLQAENISGVRAIVSSHRPVPAVKATGVFLPRQLQPRMPISNDHSSYFLPLAQHNSKRGVPLMFISNHYFD